MPVMRLQLAVRDTLIDPLVWHLMWAWNLGELQRLGDGHPWFRGWIARQRRLRKEEEGRGRSQNASLPAELPELPPDGHYLVEERASHEAPRQLGVVGVDGVE